LCTPGDSPFAEIEVVSQIRLISRHNFDLSVS